ncbi:Gag-Pol polyprotein [Gossypium australe]|uniref:Gag-Pol polyprotein n=1 Tax=Gossypium australe TaxID=47621 RepID=A0A5B6WSA9_9ROSI|nr:Gag-Pol polyprotein [Gossypium australe]
MFKVYYFPSERYHVSVVKYISIGGVEGESHLGILSDRVLKEIHQSTGRMTVTEYEREFVRLSKYAREYVSTKEVIAFKAEELSKEKRKVDSEARDSRKRPMSKP